MIGDFVRGWEKYEWRWRNDKLPLLWRAFSQPLWMGKENIAGKTILLHAEQGLGDAIQFVRYLGVVAQRGAKVLLEVQPELKSLMAGFVGAHQVLARGEPHEDFDFHCPLLSLPLAFQTRLETIPARVPYLLVAQDASRKWKSRLGRKDAPRVGIVWFGNPVQANDRNRSTTLSTFVGIAVPGVRLVSLQRELRDGDGGILADYGIKHFGPGLEDFRDTAALVSQMDLVVTVDTAVAHLAGALGKPVWILLSYASDWRWLLNREDSPWYPTVRLFRQPQMGDWNSVIEKVRHELQKLFLDS